MIKKTIINGTVFIAQTTYYIYKDEQSIQNSPPMLTTSDRRVFNNQKTLYKKGKLNNNIT